MVRKLILPRRKICRMSYGHYGQRRAYFITVVTASRWRFFGQYEGQQLNLSACGHLVRQIWNEIPNQFPFVQLDKFVVMPDHIHGILIIKEKLLFPPEVISYPARGGATGFHNPMLHDNLSRIVRWFKGRTTFEIRKIRKDFKWHPRFHDRILRKSELIPCRHYIRTNPKDWQKWL